jgi:hypothetical protein
MRVPVPAFVKVWVSKALDVNVADSGRSVTGATVDAHSSSLVLFFQHGSTN